MHECPECGQACDCDLEDHWQDPPDNCDHDCDEDDDYEPLDDAGEGEHVELGACCACGQSGPTVRNVLMLHVKALHAGPGCWGCFQCGLPTEGAAAVLCDACMVAGAEIRFACDCSPAAGGRVAIEMLTEPFEHDMSKHRKCWPQETRYEHHTNRTTSD